MKSFPIILTLVNILFISNQNPEEVLNVARLVNNYFMNKYPDPTIPTFVNKTRPSSLWTRAVYYEGLMELQDIDPHEEYLNYSLVWAGFHKWTPRDGVQTVDADNQCCAQTYVKLHEGAKEGDFQKVFENVSLLQAAIPGMVYPQFVRINENEEELESFFRFWNEKTNPAGGNFIIQKYDDFAGLLPSRKPADLSPVERIPCWHLRRDMTILSNGDVPSCRTYLFAGITGNVFEDSLEKIWHKTDEVLQKHIEKQYINKCERCDEFYTYNF